MCMYDKNYKYQTPLHLPATAIAMPCFMNHSNIDPHHFHHTYLQYSDSRNKYPKHHSYIYLYIHTDTEVKLRSCWC